MTPFTDADRAHLEAAFGHVPDCLICGEPSIARTDTGDPVHLLCLPDSAFTEEIPGHFPEDPDHETDMADRWVSHPAETSHWAAHNSGLDEHDPSEIPDIKGPTPRTKGAAA